MGFACPKAFKEYFPKALDNLEFLWNYFDENVRIVTYRCYANLILGMIKLTNNSNTDFPLF